MKYNSGLDKQDTTIYYPEEERVFYQTPYVNATAFYWNIEDSDKLPADYDSCDLFYSEIPWTLGYKKLAERGGILRPDFSHFMENIVRIMGNNHHKSMCLLMGKSMLKLMPFGFHHAIDVDLNGYTAKAVLVNIDPEGLDFTNYLTLIDSLANRYFRVGDFCCGYGNTGKIFARHGKGFVMSDINKRCIGFIRDNIKEWYENI